MGTQFAAVISKFKNTKLLSARNEHSKEEERNPHERGRFPLILDDYVLREFLTTFALVHVQLCFVDAGVYLF